MDAPRPRIVVTVANSASHPDPDLAARRNALYAAAIERAGGAPELIDVRADDAERSTAFASMTGLLLTGGVDVDPSRYGRPVRGSIDVQMARDALEAEAWAAAADRHVPVLGICRGLQVINVFSGGTLIQDVAGHAGGRWGSGPAMTHPLRLQRGSRLAAVLDPSGADVAGLVVNSYHHQGVLASDLAPGLLASAWAASPAGDLIEGLEAPGERFIIGVQCHPERTESTPDAFERLFAAFVEAARGAARIPPAEPART